MNPKLEAAALEALMRKKALADKHPKIDRERIYGRWVVEHFSAISEALAEQQEHFDGAQQPGDKALLDWLDKNLATQQPLTDAAIDSLYQHMAADERTKPFTAQNWFQAGVASAEAALGITGSKP